jgi:hypothetical protein
MRLYRTFCIEGFVFCRCQQPTPQLLPAGATLAGWDIFLPLDQRALFTAHGICGLVGRRQPSQGLHRRVKRIQPEWRDNREQLIDIKGGERPV